MRAPLRALAAILIGLAAVPATIPAQEADPLHIELAEGIGEPLAIAIPAFIDEGGAGALTAEVRDIVARDLTGTGLFVEVNAALPSAAPAPAASPPVTAAPAATTPAAPAPAAPFDQPVDWGAWRATGAQALIVGAVQVVDGHVFVRFRLYDLQAARPVGDGIQFDAAPEGMRRIAHRLAGEVYARLTGERPYFDSRIAFVSESGPRASRVKRLALMDYDGANVRYLTDGNDLVLSPHFSPDGRRLAYVSFAGGVPRIAIFDLETMTATPVPAPPGSMAFGPRFSPDGRSLVFSQERAGNTDIWKIDLATGASSPLVEGPGIDTAPSISPDGTSLAFESDRSGAPQLYLMPMAGGEPERISFGDGRYGTPVWSPGGDLIAFTLQKDGSFFIGAIAPDGTGERLLTNSPHDEGPSWAPNGRVVVFTRQQQGGEGRAQLQSVDITGRNMAPVALKDAASDPDWGPLLP